MAKILNALRLTGNTGKTLKPGDVAADTESRKEKGAKFTIGFYRKTV